MAVLTENKVIVEEKSLCDSLAQKGFGERKPKELILDLNEAIYLLGKEKIKIEDLKGKKVSKKKLLELAEKLDKKFFSNYLVYFDLRERGFVVKTGYKFGFAFRVYPRGKKQGEAHTKWVIFVARERDKKSMTELSRMNRLAGNLNTALLLAVIDNENAINYYEVNRITP